MESNEKLYVSVSEAANMLAVTSETVRNYVKRGVLDGRHTPSNCVVLLDSLKQFARMDKTSIYQRQQAIKQMEEELDNRRKKLEKSIKKMEQCERERKDEFEKNDVIYNVLRRRIVLSEFIGACVNIMQEVNGNHHEAEAVRMVLAGYSYDKVAERFKLSYERARQLFFKGVQRLGKIEEYRALKEENNRLSARIAEQANEIKVLNAEIIRLNDVIHTQLKMQEDIEQTLGKDYDPDKMASMVNASLLCKSFMDESLALSTRTINILKYMDVETFYDLVRIPAKEILRKRNAGKKTVYEIEDRLERYGLKLGMSHNEIHEWLVINLK